LKKKPNIIIGSVGRLADLIRSGHIGERVLMCVVDEFDQLILEDTSDMRDIIKGLSDVSPKMQLGLFSATYNKDDIDDVLCGIFDEANTYELTLENENVMLSGIE
jgi:superfamily II DNA/RNA helicase